jgi:hypothetical protein
LADTGDVKPICHELSQIAEKIGALSNELSRVTKGHIDTFSPDELASMIETLVRNKFKKTIISR